MAKTQKKKISRAGTARKSPVKQRSTASNELRESRLYWAVQRGPGEMPCLFGDALLAAENAEADERVVLCAVSIVRVWLP